MPHKPLRGCAVYGCPNRVEKDGDIYCKVHKPKEEKKYETYLRKYDGHKRYDARWKQVREIYIKSHPFCEECLKEEKVVKANIVHHKVPIEVDETKKYDLDNLESLCASCHKKIHDLLGAPIYKF